MLFINNNSQTRFYHAVNRCKAFKISKSLEIFCMVPTKRLLIFFQLFANVNLYFCNSLFYKIWKELHEHVQ